MQFYETLTQVYFGFSFTVLWTPKMNRKEGIDGKGGIEIEKVVSKLQKLKGEQNEKCTS